MNLKPRARKLALTAHVASSVGWFGAVVAFLGLGVVGLVSDDPQTVRGAYLAMKPTAWLVLLPLAVTSLVTGLIQSLGTTWGLFRHYWVVFKLGINVLATAVLLVYMGTFDAMADVASDPSADLDTVRTLSPVLHAGAALVLLLTAIVLALYKPRGLTPYGQRQRHRLRVKST